MKTIRDLTFGYRDAENYRRKENKDMLNRFFVHTKALDELLDPGRYFLVGEKGTGKTAYAVFLANNNYHEVAASLKIHPGDRVSEIFGAEEVTESRPD